MRQRLRGERSYKKVAEVAKVIRVAKDARKTFKWIPGLDCVARSKKLTLLVYRLTEEFPKSEEFGLKGQMRRAAVSVMSQIAEGWLRRSKRDKLHYLEIAEGSLLELESQAEVVKEVVYWRNTEYQEFSEQHSRVVFLLYRYKKKIEE